MKKHFSFDEKIFIAGVNGMVGSAIFRKLKLSGYGNQKMEVLFIGQVVKS